MEPSLDGDVLVATVERIRRRTQLILWGKTRMTQSLHRWCQHLARSARVSPLLNPRTVEQRNTLLLYLSTALIGVPFGGIISFLPVFLARLGATPTLIGW